jgi:hypothetical protein
MKTSATKPRVVILVREEPLVGGGTILRFTLHELACDDSGHPYPRGPENIGKMFTGHGELGLHFYQSGIADRRGAYIPSLEPEYMCVHFVDGLKARKMRATLVSLQTKLNRVYVKLGPARTASTCLLMLAAATGAKEVIWRTPGKDSWTCEDLADGARYVLKLDELASANSATSDPAYDADGQGRR